MRRICIVLTSVVLWMVMAISSALADEIVFRSVAWKQNYDDVVDALGSDFIWGSPKTILGKYVLAEIEQRSSNYDRNYPCVCTVTTSNKTKLKVAGYDISFTKLFFAYTPNENGEIDHSIKNTSFYMAQYAIDPVDTENARADLTTKLSAIYGTARSMENTDDCASGAKTYQQWSGDNGTKVVLIQEDMSFSDEPTLYLYYFTDEGTTMIKEAEAIQKQAEANELMNAGSDGL